MDAAAVGRKVWPGQRCNRDQSLGTRCSATLGGGAKSAVWQQIKADVSKKPIGALAEPECASLGVAILSAVALGYYESAESAARLANAVTDWRQPDETQFALYDRLYVKYSALYERLEPLF